MHRRLLVKSTRQMSASMMDCANASRPVLESGGGPDADSGGRDSLRIPRFRDHSVESTPSTGSDYDCFLP